jgi:hypothetical protein
LPCQRELREPAMLAPPPQLRSERRLTRHEYL